MAADDPLEEPDDPGASLRFVAAIGDLQDHVGSVMVSAAAGYRRALVDAGFTEGAAELMTIDYHRVVLEAVIVKRPHAAAVDSS